MKIDCIFISKRRAVFEIENEMCYKSDHSNQLYLNGTLYGTTDRNVFSIDGLQPGNAYTLEVRDEVKDNVSGKVDFTTEREYVRLNVKKFGARGDAHRDDTVSIQAAIMACPENSTVFIPKGEYRVVSLFLKSGITLELAEGAVVKAIENRALYGILPGFIETTDEKDEYYLGSWEGNPLDTFTSVITGINVSNVVITGSGCIDGNASFNEWWNDPRTRRGAWRPRTIFLTGCKNIILEGITVRNSPSWAVHPLFTEDLMILNCGIYNPPDSPNTDGIDPESCKNVKVIGTRISVGDDCLVIKSGKIYLGKKLKRPSENIMVRNCLMERGHGAVVMGSEIAGGVKNVTISKCFFSNTDKGIRIKTRRGRGKDSIIEGIKADTVFMDGVGVPIAIYAFYYCDPDGKSDYVGTQDPLPVDERTPEIRDIHLRNITAVDAHIAAAYINGLPEKKIEEVHLENIEISFAHNALEGYPAMITHCERTSKLGFFVKNVKNLYVSHLKVTGGAGEPLIIDAVDQIHKT